MKILSATLHPSFIVRGQPETSDGLTTPPVATAWQHETPRTPVNLSAPDAVHVFEFRAAAAAAVSKVLDNFPAVELGGSPVKDGAGSFLSFAKLAALSIQVQPLDESAAFSGTVTIERTGIFGTGAQTFTARGLMVSGLEAEADWQAVDASTELSVSISAGANAKAVIVLAGRETDGHNYYS